MLYKKITTVALSVFAFLSSPTQGGTYYLSDIGFVNASSSNPFYCPGTDTCEIYCDVVEHKQLLEFHCGSATDCVFHCDAKKCLSEAIIKGENSNNLNFTVGPEGQECCKEAEVFAPDYGNAYFINGNIAPKGYRGITIYSGSNTQEIILNCDGTAGGGECKNTLVYASSAQFLRINVGFGQEMEAGTIQCPVDSQYNGIEVAPCVIDATNGIMIDMNIVAPDGIPIGVWIPGCGTCTDNVNIQCDTVDTLNGAQSGLDAWPWDYNSDCWWNPTLEPTIQPTIHPTVPTFIPTIQPTVPTFIPTIQPTIHPTVPTFAPPSAPTVSDSKPIGEETQADDSSFWKILAIVTSILSVCLLVTLAVVLYSNYKPRSPKVEEELMGEMKPQLNVNPQLKAPGSIDDDTKEKSNDETRGRKESVELVHHDMISELLKSDNTVQIWLETKAKCPQYLANFIGNGYDTMDIIAEIKGVSHLEEIGIQSLEDQNVIIREIEKLQCSVRKEGVTKRDDIMIYYDNNDQQISLK